MKGKVEMVDLNELKLKMEMEQSSYYVINSDLEYLDFDCWTAID